MGIPKVGLKLHLDKSSRSVHTVWSFDPKSASRCLFALGQRPRPTEITSSKAITRVPNVHIRSSRARASTSIPRHGRPSQRHARSTLFERLRNQDRRARLRYPVASAEIHSAMSFSAMDQAGKARDSESSVTL